MKKIMLFCNAGMSTSMLVTKMREAATKQGFVCEINAYPLSEAEKLGNEADCVLLGPQVRYELKRVQGMLKVPVEAIDPVAYGMMNGSQVLDQAKKLMGE